MTSTHRCRPDDGFATRAIRAGQDPCSATGSTVVPIYQTATFTQEAVGVTKGFDYSRSGNPTRLALERQLAPTSKAGASGRPSAPGWPPSQGRARRCAREITPS